MENRYTLLVIWVKANKDTLILSGISRKKSYVKIFKYGNGKTYLTTLILAKLGKECRIALAVASSRITFTLLPGIRTAHPAFKLSLDLYLNENFWVGRSYKTLSLDCVWWIHYDAYEGFGGYWLNLKRYKKQSVSNRRNHCSFIRTFQANPSSYIKRNKSWRDSSMLEI